MIATEEKFNNDIEYGKLGEEKVYSYFRGMIKNGKPAVEYVMDVRDIKLFQDLDVDFIVEFKSGTIIMVEVKTDRVAYKTGNLVFETLSNENPGCLARSEADAVCYVVPETNKMYYVNLKSLKGYIASKGLKAVPMGDNAKGHLIAIKDIVNDRVGYEYDI